MLVVVVVVVVATTHVEQLEWTRGRFGWRTKIG
jgi:hypothetical protein